MEQDHDLLIITDATASMSNYLEALHQSLPQIISVSALTGCFSRIGLLAYRDYSEDKDELLEWFGWVSLSLGPEWKQPNLTKKAESLEAFGGGDFPEAVKTALAKAYEVMRPEAKTIILLYTDARPHATKTRGGYSNAPLEVTALCKPDSYGGFGPKFLDWVSACNQLRNGEKKAQVFCVLENSMLPQWASFYYYLSTITRGSCFHLENSRPESISRVTMALLISWMGVEKVDPSKKGDEESFPAHMSRYINVAKIKQLKNEEDEEAAIFFTDPNPSPNLVKKVSDNTTSTKLTNLTLQKYLPKKDNPVADFAKSWATDTAYQAMAVRHLRNIIDEDVTAITLNPVFGTLWRAICNDRKHEARDQLVEAFSYQISKITDDEKRARAKAWLEESYDYTGEVLETIASVPEEDRYPCVFLDPTLGFTRPDTDMHDEDDDDANRSITGFTRAELLEIGRTCDPRILRRLGRVLTRLTYVEKSTDMPEHIAATSDEEVPKIPMALASQEHQAKFWKILLHTIVPGTLLSTRPAALLAALSLRLGIAPLTQAAEREMMRFKNNWNDIETPENWNVSCLSLLLDADQAYRKRQESLRQQSDEMDIDNAPSLLKQNDRELFQSLCTFRMLELNLDSTLTARVGWTPEKTLIPMGPLITCRSCKYPRSVTIMGKNQKCGVCAAPDYKSPEEAERCSRVGVSMDHNESTQATWVECCIRSCRAQYVVYNVDDLNVRAKCHYCREGKTEAPWVECKQCLNRMIWPKAYRPSSFVSSEFSCPACDVGRRTIVDVESTAKKISDENTISWLIRDSKVANPDETPFSNRSLYHTISTIGTDNFVSRFNLFPQTKDPLTLRGKLIQNTPDLISTLQTLISQRQTERPTCSLCFSTFRQDAVQPACGRRGCFQRICKGCLSGWYRLNQPGRIINVAALSCPFCRRFPSPRTLVKYGMGVHSVRDLVNSIRDQGTWIYAWCEGCYTAKQYMERVCARGMPNEIDKWSCDPCVEAREQERLDREERAREQALADAQAAEDMEARERALAALRRIQEKRGVPIFVHARECPGCGTMTEKISGCGHITCPVKGCGTHYCYFCGKKGWGSQDVYDHMQKAHGGLYGEVEDDDDDLVDDEYWE